MTRRTGLGAQTSASLSASRRGRAQRHGLLDDFRDCLDVLSANHPNADSHRTTRRIPRLYEPLAKCLRPTYVYVDFGAGSVVSAAEQNFRVRASLLTGCDVACRHSED